MADTLTLMLSFDPPDQSGVVRLSWVLDGHESVTARLQLLFDDGAGNYDPVSAARLQTLLNVPPLLG